MKTTEIAAYIADKNVKLWAGGCCPMMPMVPLTSRRPLDVGWFAFQLINVLEQNLPAHGSAACQLWWNPTLKCFGFFLTDWSQKGWELVIWDGYGELESWKEVAP